MKDCDDSGDGEQGSAPAMMIFVKAHLEDSLGNVVGESRTTWTSELSNEDGDLLGDR